MEVDHDRGDPRPVLRRRPDTLGGLPSGDRAAAAAPLDEWVLGDLHRDRRDVHGWVVASFFKHDSRDHDPQLHIHNGFLNRVQGPDGVW